MTIDIVNNKMASRMKKKIIAVVIIFSLLIIGTTITFREGTNERVEKQQSGEELTDASNFKVVITSPEEGESFQEDEIVNIEYTVENTGEVEDTQEIVTSVNDEKINKTEVTLEGGETKAETYKFDAGYWSDKFEITEVKLDSVKAPDLVELGDEFEANGTGHYAYKFPESEEEALTEDHLEDYRFTIRNETGGDILMEVPAEEIELTPKENFSTFDAMIPTEGIESKGEYVLQLEALGNHEARYKTISTNLTLKEKVSNLDMNVNDLGLETEETSALIQSQETTLNNEEEKEFEIKVSSEDEEDSVAITIREGSDLEEIKVDIIEPKDDEKFTMGDEIQIEFEVNNPEDKAIKVSLLIENDERILNETWEGDDIKTEDSYRGTYTWEPEVEGEYNISVAVDGLYLTVRYDQDMVSVTLEEETPGFTSIVLLIGAVVAVAIYQKKE